MFIGYSLDDADLRELLVLLRERLGRMTRPTWAILAADPNNEAPRFERRGIRPIILDANPKADRATVLAQFFAELRTTWEHEIESQLEARTDSTTAELRSPRLAPQLALFVASRSLIGLYRDYVFPSVPQTGLLPLGIDEVRAQDRAMTPMAIDMALSKAAVVVYDTGRDNRLPLDYVHSRRSGAPVLVVSEQASADPALVPLPDTLLRPKEMREWPAFTEAVKLQVMYAKERVQPSDLGSELSRLALEDNSQLLLTSLALLEGKLRGQESMGTSITPGGARMQQLSDYYGRDFEAVIQAVRIRHDLMQNIEVPSPELDAAAMSLLGLYVGSSSCRRSLNRSKPRTPLECEPALLALPVIAQSIEGPPGVSRRSGCGS